ncbi:hypothetical protein GGR51DRAFT_517274 [Nemania sp. FL0031]|nr:hypothetical protein GGR51DRAFT_517274 [Nemania sp. FL0031]
MSGLDFSRLYTDDLLKALDGPALSPPDGVNPNFEHPPNRDGVALAGLVVSLILATTFLFIRIYVKFFIIKQICMGDYLITIAYTFYLVVVIESLIRVNSTVPLFVHQWNVRGRDIKEYLLHIFISVEFWIGAILLVKSSILLEWLRIFAPTGSRPFTLSCTLLLVVTILFYVASILALNLSCRPFNKIWDKTVEGTCIDIKSIHLGVVTANLFLDLAILILPQPVIWSLQMTRLRRAGVSTVFTIGVLAIVAAGFLINAVISWIHTDDMTYYYSSVTLWGIAETTCGILVFSVPYAPRFFQDIDFPTWLVNFFPIKLFPDGRAEWRQEPSGEQQSYPHVSKQGDYREIVETGRMHLGGCRSLRRADRQYGIAVTTDIVVTESYEPSDAKIGHQHQWTSTVSSRKDALS